MVNLTQNCLPIVDWLKNWFTSTEDLLDKTYPVGSIYMSVNNASPQTLFGGTWVQLQDTFLYATSTTADTGTTAPSGQGEATHTLTTDEMPSHNHGRKSLQGTMRVMTWTGTRSGIVTVQSPLQQDRTASSGSAMGNNTFTIDATHTHDSNGGGQAHNNMPPYMKVFMWKRTA